MTTVEEENRGYTENDEQELSGAACATVIEPLVEAPVLIGVMSVAGMFQCRNCTPDLSSAR